MCGCRKKSDSGVSREFGNPLEFEVQSIAIHRIPIGARFVMMERLTVADFSRRHHQFRIAQAQFLLNQRGSFSQERKNGVYQAPIECGSWRALTNRDSPLRWQFHTVPLIDLPSLDAAALCRNLLETSFARIRNRFGVELGSVAESAPQRVSRSRTCLDRTKIEGSRSVTLKLEFERSRYLLQRDLLGFDPIMGSNARGSRNV